MNKAFLTPILTVLFLSTTTHAGLSDDDKLGIGLGILGAVLESSNDKKAEQQAKSKLPSVDYTNVSTQEDCHQKYAEVLTIEQLESKKDWVLNIANKIQKKCDAAIEKNQVRLAEEKRKREAAQRAERQKRQAAAAQKEKENRNKKHRDYLEMLQLKKEALSASTLNNWKPLYNSVYSMTMADAKKYRTTARTPDQLKKALQLEKELKGTAHQLSECYYINMADTHPDAPMSDVKRIAKALKTQNRYYMPSQYQNSIGFTSLSCSLFAVDPS